jgi:hypothetical protein
MTDTTSSARPNVLQLILVPAIITLAITVIRLVGELQHWSPLFFNASPGGGFAILGISWLPFIFGPYFAVKLANAGEGMASAGKTIGFAILGMVMMVAGGAVVNAPMIQFPGKLLVGILLMAAAILPQLTWRALFKTLLAYGFAARIPVAIIMFFAIQGTWGTHYDGLPPNYNGPADLLGKYVFVALLPQLVIWPVFTVVIGSLFGGIAAAIARRGKPAIQTAA